MRQRAYRRYGSRRKRRNFRAWALLSIVLVLVLTVLGLILFLPKEEGRFGSELKRLEAPENAELIPFSAGAVYIDPESQSLYYLNRNGEAKWGFSGTVSGMKTAVSSSRMAVYYSSKLQVIGNNGSLIYSKVFDYPIQDLKLSDGVCAFLQYQGTAKNVVVVSAAGEQLDTLTEQTGQELLDFGVFGSAGVWQITVDTGSVKPVYRFFTYRYESNKLITVSYTTSDQMIYYPVFYKDSISLIGTSDVISIDYTGKFLRRVRCNGYELARRDTQYTSAVLLMKPVGQARNETLCIDGDFSSFVLSEQEPILETVLTDRYYYVFTQHHLYTYAVGKMTRKRYTLPETISRVLPGLEKQVVLIGESGRYLLALD